MMNLNEISIGEIKSMQAEVYIQSSMLAMRARFSQFVITPEQVAAWEIGFGWIHQISLSLAPATDPWLVMPEFVAPLISGRPDLVIATPTHLVIVEMKTGELPRREGDKRQTLGYATDIWGKLKGARGKMIVPVLLSKSGKDSPTPLLPWPKADSPPSSIFELTPIGLAELLREIASKGDDELVNLDVFRRSLVYSPRPSVVEAATSLVARLEDKNVITGLSDSEEIDRVIQSLLDLAKSAETNSERVVAIVTGSPGAGKTLVGLRLAHDADLQSSLDKSLGTPLFLTGNSTLVEVLVESIARDENRRTGQSLRICRQNANSKVKLVHGVVGSELGIESNVVVFDEGQRVWTAEHMRAKKGNKSLGSEASEVLRSLEGHPWALLTVLVGEGQEINTGEEGAKTWVDAVAKANQDAHKPWKLVMPPLESFPSTDWARLSKSLQLSTTVRTDNAANISGWVQCVLEGDQNGAINIRNAMQRYPIFVSRDIDEAKTWIISKRSELGGTSGLLASSKSKRLLNYGVDVASDANRSINWGAWYLDSLPSLNSSEALELAATEFKSQGLELDWSLVGWSWDLIFKGGSWQTRTLNASRGQWQQTRNLAKLQFQLNAYRVLLTRSRKGMVIWIPSGDASDSMRSSEMDEVAGFLISCGATPI